MHPSDSKVQQNAEKIILRKIEEKIGLCSKELCESKVFLKERTYVNFDGYNEDKGIVVEVYARIGKLAPSQEKKIVSDVMKMILAETVLNRKLRKIIAVCDDTVYKQITGSSWKSLAITEFKIEILQVELENNIKEEILDAQKKQYR